MFAWGKIQVGTFLYKKMHKSLQPKFTTKQHKSSLMHLNAYLLLFINLLVTNSSNKENLRIFTIYNVEYLRGFHPPCPQCYKNIINASKQIKTCSDFFYPTKFGAKFFKVPVLIIFPVQFHSLLIWDTKIDTAPILNHIFL